MVIRSSNWSIGFSGAARDGKVIVGSGRSHAFTTISSERASV
jgi:hypothetical protein